MTRTYPLVIDGGLSNVLEAQGCNLDHPLWTARLLESEPEEIVQVHLRYLEAGAQCIITASYQASIPGLLAMGYTRSASETLLVKTITLAEQAIAHFLTGQRGATVPLIAASIGPYGAYLADGSEYRGDYGVSRQTLIDFHRERLHILEDTRADVWACETIPSRLEAEVLADLLLPSGKPAWISFACRNEQQLNDGTPIEEAVSCFLDHPNVWAIGVNCTAPRHIANLIRAMKPLLDKQKIIVYPNSGESFHAPSKSWRGTADPEVFVDMAGEWLDLGAQIIGGCCRIGPDHIRRLRDSLS